MKKRNFISKVKCCMLIVHVRFSFLLKGLFLVLILFTLPQFEAKAEQAPLIAKNEVSAFAFDGFPVNVIVEGYNNFYIDAIYANRTFVWRSRRFYKLFRSIQI